MERERKYSARVGQQVGTTSIAAECDSKPGSDIIR